MKNFRSWLKLWALSGMLSLFATGSNFLSNRFEVTVQDLALPVILDLLAAALIAGVFWRLWRRDRLAGTVATGLSTILLTGGYDDRLTAIFPLLKAISPLPKLGGADIAVLSLVFIALVLWICGRLGRAASALATRRHWKALELTKGLFVAVGATFASLYLPIMADMVAEWPQFFYRPPALETTKTQTTNKPDIYYIVLDRYASQDVLQAQFGFDNSNFLAYLHDNGYYTNPSAHNNYPYTTMSIASTMSAGYLNDQVKQFGNASHQTTAPFNETIRDSPVARALRGIGYQYNLVGNWYETSNTSYVADATYQQTGQLTVLGQTIALNNFAKNQLLQSPLWRFLQGGLNLWGFKALTYTNLGDIDMTHYALQSLKDLAAKPAGGRFIFAHILVPHDPYYFNADGSLNINMGSDDNGEAVKQKYLNQVKYINSQMTGILSQIKTAGHGQSIVVLQADEGPYPFQINDGIFDEADVDGELGTGDMRAWSDADLAMKYGNLAAYYLPGTDLAADHTGADSVNIFRLILNTYFDQKLAYLPQCYYAYPNGRDEPMAFTDITARLTGHAADARCQANGSVSP